MWVFLSQMLMSLGEKKSLANLQINTNTEFKPPDATGQDRLSDSNGKEMIIIKMNSQLYIFGCVCNSAGENSRFVYFLSWSKYGRNILTPKSNTIKRLAAKRFEHHERHYSYISSVGEEKW